MKSANYRLLITLVPASAKQAGRGFTGNAKTNEVPVFETMIRRTVSFAQAAEKGVLVHQTGKKDHVVWVLGGLRKGRAGNFGILGGEQMSKSSFNALVEAKKQRDGSAETAETTQIGVESENKSQEKEAMLKNAVSEPNPVESESTDNQLPFRDRTNATRSAEVTALTSHTIKQLK